MSKKWYEQSISKDLATNFFQQLKEFTAEYIINYAPDLAITWPPSNRLMGIGEYNPKGAVIHSTRTPSIWNTFRTLLHNVYGTHITVMFKKHVMQYADRYNLLKELPSDAFMIYDLNTPIQHSGYISPVTWGIDLRNTGILRPFDSKLRAPPLNVFEEVPRNFRRAYQYHDDINMYWNYNYWRESFLGSTYNYEGYYYEKPSRMQVESLIVILRCMSAYSSDFNPEMIIPANCIHGMQPEFPIIPWQLINDYLDPNTNIDFKSNESEWLKLFVQNTKYTKCVWEMHDIEDPTWVNNQLRQAGWRADLNSGHLRYVMESEPDNEFTNSLFTQGLSAEGYPVYGSDDMLQMSIRMYETSHKIQTYRRSDTLSHLYKTALIYNRMP